MNNHIKSIFLAIVFGLCLVENTTKVQAIDNQELYSRIGLATGLSITAAGIYYLGFVDFPKKALTTFDKFVSTFIEVSPLLLINAPIKVISTLCAKGVQKRTRELQNRVAKKRNNALKSIALGVIISTISAKYLE